MRKIFISALFIALFATCAFADGEIIKLPDPVKTGGMTLTEAITLRHSAREFADVDISLQDLSNLLYVTAGVNRENGLRVYPVAMGIQDTFIYVFNREGVYKYDALTHSLELITKGDHRQDTGKPEFVGQAAINLAYVNDINLWSDSKAPKELILRWVYAHAGAAMQNAYLFAASQGWNAVIRGSFDTKKVSDILKLKDGQNILLIHSIGPRP